VNYFGDSDIPTMMAEFGVPITIGGVSGVGIPDRKGEVFPTTDGPDLGGGVVMQITQIWIQTTAFPDCKVDDPIVFDGETYSVRDRLPSGDGALTAILLGIPGAQ
jgi:hypothetical protein